MRKLAVVVVSALITAALLWGASTAFGDFIVIPRGTGAGETGRVRFRELAAGGTHSVDLKAPDSLAATNVYTLPSALPLGGDYSLVGNTSGVMSWKNISGGSGSGGGLTLVESQSASASASVNFTSCITSTYDIYKIVLDGVIVATDGSVLYLRMSTNGGSSYDAGATDYDWTNDLWSALGPGVDSDTDSTHIRFASPETQDTSNSAFSYSGVVYLFHPNSTSLWKVIQGNGHYWGNFGGSNIFAGHTLLGVRKTTTAVNAFQFVADSGNIASGTIRCYGLDQ